YRGEQQKHCRMQSGCVCHGHVSLITPVYSRTLANGYPPLPHPATSAMMNNKTAREETMHGSSSKPSRRRVLKAGAALIAGASATPRSAFAQTDADLARLQSARRILLKGGIVLTLDRQIGDFAQADVLIEDGKIREIRPNIAAEAVVIDAGNRILVPGF